MESRRAMRRRMVDRERRARERRRRQRRGVYDRRSWIGRRLADRRVYTPSPYTPEEADVVRRSLSAETRAIACPRCQSMVILPNPEVKAGVPVWDVRCDFCYSAATISSISAAILLVAADAMMREALSLVLAKAGHQIFEESTGGAGLRSYSIYAPDVVVVDIHLDDMDFVDFTRRLLRFDSRARVVAMAGPRRHGAPDPLATAKRLGAANILRKPFPPDDMLRVVNELLKARS